MWKQIEEAPLYAVSDQGEIRSSITGKVLKPATLKCGGYQKVCLKTDKGELQRTVHRIVCFAFYGPPPTSKHIVAHADGDPKNNAASNVRWATRAENEKDKVDHGRSNRGSRNGQSKLSEAVVLEARRRVSEGEKITALASEFGVSHPTLSIAVNGSGWGHVIGE